MKQQIRWMNTVIFYITKLKQNSMEESEVYYESNMLYPNKFGVRL